MSLVPAHEHVPIEYAMGGTFCASCGWRFPEPSAERLFCLECGEEAVGAYQPEVDGEVETAFTPFRLEPCGHTNGARVVRDAKRSRP